MTQAVALPCHNSRRPRIRKRTAVPSPYFGLRRHGLKHAPFLLAAYANSGTPPSRKSSTDVLRSPTMIGRAFGKHRQNSSSPPVRLTRPLLTSIAVSFDPFEITKSTSSSLSRHQQRSKRCVRDHASSVAPTAVSTKWPRNAESDSRSSRPPSQAADRNREAFVSNMGE